MVVLQMFMDNVVYTRVVSVNSVSKLSEFDQASRLFKIVHAQLN